MSRKRISPEAEHLLDVVADEQTLRGRLVLVHLVVGEHTTQTIRGKVDSVGAGGWDLAHAEALFPDGTETPIEGVAYCPRDRMIWSQVLPNG